VDRPASERERLGVGVEPVEDLRRICRDSGEAAMEIEVDRAAQPDSSVPVVVHEAKAEALQDLLRTGEIGLSDEEVDVVIWPLPQRVVEPPSDRRALHEQIRDVVRVERRDHLDRDRVECECHAHDLRSLEAVRHQY
jgi:hypothetical protein